MLIRDRQARAMNNHFGGCFLALICTAMVARGAYQLVRLFFLR